MGYALQWFAFASIAALGFLLLVVREAREERHRLHPTPEDVHPQDTEPAR